MNGPNKLPNVKSSGFGGLTCRWVLRMARVSPQDLAQPSSMHLLWC